MKLEKTDQVDGMKTTWLPQTIASVMLLWALNPGNPYDYYILLRIVCFAVFTYLALKASKMNIEWTWVFGTFAVVYNPIIRVHLSRPIWSVVNVASVVALVLSVFKLETKRKEVEQD